MRIDIDDPWGQRYTISTQDPVLAGQWFAEWSRRLLNVNAAIPPATMHVYPTTHQEDEMLRHGQAAELTEDAIRKLAGVLLNYADELHAVKTGRADT